ncbi:hypothetical protein pb186bvf_004192 [Paramecium bursaria]
MYNLAQQIYVHLRLYELSLKIIVFLEIKMENIVTIQLEQINQLQDEEATQTFAQFFTESKPQSITFTSLRQRYSGLVSDEDKWQLPKKYESLLQTLKNIDHQLNKNKAIRIDMIKFPYEVLQLGMVQQIDNQIYDLKQTKQTLEVRLKQSENSSRTNIRAKLEEMVLKTYRSFLAYTKQEDFLDFSFKYKVYHPSFDVDKCENLQVASDFKYFQQAPECIKLIRAISKYFKQRKVTCAYYNSLLIQLKERTDLTIKEIENLLILLIKTMPDFISIPNRLDTITRQRWLVQINSKYEEEDAVMDFQQIIS